jgi:hypothetical protein
VEIVYNEEYYIERERELIRQSNLELEEKHTREMRKERPTSLSVQDLDP